VFAAHLPVLFDLHSRLGAGHDPLDVAGWFG
jgi:hypothetical protein